jgi:Zn-finger nucleic acid-binding protein
MLIYRGSNALGLMSLSLFMSRRYALCIGEPLMMKCSKCRVKLKMYRRHGFILWKCQACEGRAVAVPVVRREVRDPTIVDQYIACAERRERLGRGCPSCRKRAVACRVPGKMELDICLDCRLVWFDPEEMEQLDFSEESRERPIQAAQLPRIAEGEGRRSTPFQDRQKEDDVLLDQFLGILKPLPMVEGAAEYDVRSWASYLLLLACPVAASGALSGFVFLSGQATAKEGIPILLNGLATWAPLELLLFIWSLLAFGRVIEAVDSPLRLMQLFVAAPVLSGIAVWGLLPGEPVSGLAGAATAIAVYFTLRFPGRIMAIRDGRSEHSHFQEDEVEEWGFSHGVIALPPIFFYIFAAIFAFVFDLSFWQDGMFSSMFPPVPYGHIGGALAGLSFAFLHRQFSTRFT